MQPGYAIPQQPGCVYPFGLDPVWAIASNNLNYVNSLKMKISVIIGVVHMTLGILVKATNCIHFGRYIDFFCEFVPQLCFMLLLFGYMDFLIFYKWCVDWGYDSAVAPSIITTMINIPLQLGKTVPISQSRTTAAAANRCGATTKPPPKTPSNSGSS